jgi:hypothetical protein
VVVSPLRQKAELPTSEGLEGLSVLTRRVAPR